MFQLTSIIDNGAKIGRGTNVWHYCHIMGKAEIGENCVLGQNVFVGENVIIGNNVKIQNNVSIYDGVVIEDDVFLGPSCVFTNVKTPRAEISGRYEKTIVRKGVTIGANATIICGNELGEYSFIAAGAVVTKDVPAYALMAGVPAKQIGWVNKDGNKLGKLVCLIFSKDRAMQLQATIESFLMHCEDDVDIYVLCKTSSQLHQRQYEQLQRQIGSVRFGDEENFKAQVLAVVEQYEFVLFLVDDNIFVRDFSLANIVAVLRSYEIWDTNNPWEINWDNIDHLIFVNPLIRQCFLDNVQGEFNTPTHFIPNGIDLNEWNFIDRKPNRNIAWVNDLCHKKGVQLLAQFAFHIPSDYMVYPAGSQGDVRRSFYFNYITQAMRINNKFSTIKRYKDVQEFLKDKSYALCTSIVEGHPNALVEAMAVGIKPLIHNFPGARELFPEKYIYNTIREAVEMLDGDYNSTEYRDFIEENYDIKKVYPRIEDLF